jgi:hypothetical protein
LRVASNLKTLSYGFNFFENVFHNVLVANLIILYRVLLFFIW